MNSKSLKSKITGKEFITIIVFLLFVTIYNYFVNFHGMGNNTSNWRYYIFVIVSSLSFLVFLARNRKNISKTDGKEIGYLILTSLIFLIVSLYKCKLAGVYLPYRFFVQVSLFLLPCLYAYTLKNILSFNTIVKLMKYLTIITIIFYFLESKHNILSFFDINNYLSIDILNSKTFTESHNYFDSFLQLFLFFNFFEMKVTDINQKKSINRYRIITLIFSLMSFKRFGILFILLVLLIRKRINKKDEIRINYLFVSLLFVIVTVLYVKILQGNLLNFTYDQLFKFTSGRNWFLSLWEQKGYLSYGYGSSLLIIGRYLEMDLPQIYLELNWECLFVFVYSFFKLTKKKYYSFLIIIYVLLNMLTSSSLPWSIGWIIMFLNVFCVTSSKELNKKEEHVLV